MHSYLVSIQQIRPYPNNSKAELNIRKTGKKYCIMIFIKRRYLSKPCIFYKPEGNDILILIFLVLLAILTGILMILIGISLLIFDQIPVLNFAIILAFFGLTLFVLFYVRSIAEKKQLIG